jgi:hypothetical protein
MRKYQSNISIWEVDKREKLAKERLKKNDVGKLIVNHIDNMS